MTLGGAALLGGVVAFSIAASWAIVRIMLPSPRQQAESDALLDRVAERVAAGEEPSEALLDELGRQR
ncbi:hypothetical protein WHI96_08010 [Pseudonocardia tropica]|uniref:Uncharacterized protein n=1 Tax=Pseudonocardia tropica TaxID=681289 RepID=A0ABV1JS46_9PSEU